MGNKLERIETTDTFAKSDYVDIMGAAYAASGMKPDKGKAATPGQLRIKGMGACLTTDLIVLYASAVQDEETAEGKRQLQELVEGIDADKATARVFWKKMGF